MNESTSSETYTGTDPDAATGVLGPEGGQTTTGQSGNYDKETADRSFAVDKVTEQVETAPGKLTRLSVAVLLDSKAGNVDQQAIGDLVSAAAGIDEARGDTVEVSSMAFDTSAQDAAQEALKSEQAAEAKNQLMDLVRTLGSLLIVALVLFFAFRSARKATIQRLPMALPLPPGTIDLDAEDSEEVDPDSMELGIPEPEELAAPEPAPLPPPKELVPAALVDLIDNQPEDVAQMLRTWMTDRR